MMNAWPFHWIAALLLLRLTTSFACPLDLFGGGFLPEGRLRVEIGVDPLDVKGESQNWYPSMVHQILATLPQFDVPEGRVLEYEASIVVPWRATNHQKYFTWVPKQLIVPRGANAVVAEVRRFVELGLLPRFEEVYSHESSGLVMFFFPIGSNTVLSKSIKDQQINVDKTRVKFNVINKIYLLLQKSILMKDLEYFFLGDQFFVFPSYAWLSPFDSKTFQELYRLQYQLTHDFIQESIDLRLRP